MATTIAVICLVAMIVSVPLIILKPQWVFYMFLTAAVFGKIFYAYIFAAGALGAPRTWQPADFLFFSTLLAALFVQKEVQFPSNTIKKCLLIIAVLACISLIQGFVFNSISFSLPSSRRLYFVAAMLFALRYFTNVSRVNGFLKFSSILLLIMFVGHVLLRLGIFVPPLEFQRTVGQLAGARGELIFIPVLYLVLTSMAIGRLATKTGTVWFSLVMLFVGLAGVGLAESRTLHGGLAVIGLISMIFVRGRLKTIALLGVSLCVGVWLAGTIGLNILARWQTGAEGTFEGIVLDLWRRLEYPAIISSYIQEPYFLLTGRGVGAIHFISVAETPGGLVPYYHSEFLGWLDMFGLLGLMSLLVAWIASSNRGFVLLQSNVLELVRYGATVLLLMAALFLHSIFSPGFMQHRASPILICLVVLMANWREIYYNSYGEQYELGVDLDEGYEYYEDYPAEVIS
jgi:hypothetical protein